MEQKEITKTRLIIYVLMAYSLTCLMGILMWYGSTKGYDLISDSIDDVSGSGRD